MNRREFLHAIAGATFAPQAISLGRVLVSHDAGWYNPTKPDGGPYRPYDFRFTKFIPALRERGFNTADIDRLLRENPARAFAVAPRLL